MHDEYLVEFSVSTILAILVFLSVSSAKYAFSGTKRLKGLGHDFGGIIFRFDQVSGPFEWF